MTAHLAGSEIGGVWRWSRLPRPVVVETKEAPACVIARDNPGLSLATIHHLAAVSLEIEQRRDQANRSCRKGKRADYELGDAGIRQVGRALAGLPGIRQASQLSLIHISEPTRPY